MVRGTLLATVRNETIIGWPIEVRNAVVAAQRRGDLVACTRPQPADADGRVFVIAKLRENQPAPRRVRPAVIAAGVTAVIAAVGTVGWLLVTTVTAAGRWVGGHGAEVAVGTVLLIILLAGVGRRCDITVIHRRH